MNATISPDAVNTSDSNNPPETSHVISTTEWAHSFYLIIILLVGLVCNGIAFKTMRQKNIRHRPTSIFLSYLALVDSMALTSLSSRIIVRNLSGYFWGSICYVWRFLFLSSSPRLCHFGLSSLQQLIAALWWVPDILYTLDSTPNFFQQ